jgi:biotin operon repressor
MTQTECIRAALLSGSELTALDALNRYGCFRLAARIDELREEGLPIETVIERQGGKRYARYRLVGPVQRGLFPS